MTGAPGQAERQAGGLPQRVPLEVRVERLEDGFAALREDLTYATLLASLLVDDDD